MKRREFNLQLGRMGLGLGVGTGLYGTAAAQGGLIEGTHYTRMNEPVAVAGGGKIEVIEFFGYWCPHCAAFEPSLEAWVRKLPDYVNFRRIPVAFSAPQESYQKLYFAIEALGQVTALQGKVFTAMHGERKRLDKDAEITALAAANGVDGAKLIEAMKSFSVATKINQARNLAQSYQVDSVPMLAVAGRYKTSVSMTGTNERALAVVDMLVQQSRQK